MLKITLVPEKRFCKLFNFLFLVRVDGVFKLVLVVQVVQVVQEVQVVSRGKEGQGGQSGWVVSMDDMLVVAN